MLRRKRQIMGISIILILLIGSLIGYTVWKNLSAREENLDTEELISDRNNERIEQANQNGTPGIVVSSAKAKPGDTVDIGVSLVHNPGILGMSFTLSYDENVLKLVKAENGKAVSEVLNMSKSNDLGNGCIFLWDGEKIEEDQIQDGEILNLEFQVLRSAPAGKSPLKLTSDEGGVVDNNLKIVSLTIDDGFISVE